MITTLLTLSIKILLICWFFTQFEPIQNRVDLLNNITFKNVWLESIKSHLFDLLTCLKCLSFWATLIITQDIFAACLIGLAGQIIEKIID